MVLLLSMLTKYINANGEVKEADLSPEQVERLEAKGFQVLKDEKKPRVHVSDAACFACE